MTTQAKPDLRGQSSRALADEAVKLLIEKLALDVRMFNVIETTAVTDFYVNATGKSFTHVASLADNLAEHIAECGVDALRIEGKRGAEKDVVTRFEKKELPGKIALFILGTAFIIFGAEFLVSSGKTIALGLGISETIVGFIVIAVGTSLPELITTITAIRKKENSLSVGNIIGANIIDTTLILPLCAVISGQSLPVDKINLNFTFPVAIGVAIIATVPTVIQGRFRKWQGFALLSIYAIYLVLIVLNEFSVIALG